MTIPHPPRHLMTTISVQGARSESAVGPQGSKVAGNRARNCSRWNPPAKYTGEKDSEMSYDAVMLFLSQLSRYFRLATHVNLKKDITEYVLGFLDGFAYKWLETLDKGDKSFTWRRFERKFHEKFIPPKHFQIAIDKYLAIRQGK